MTPLQQAPWEYVSAGPWMCSIEHHGKFDMGIAYSLRASVLLTMPQMKEPEVVRLVIVDARGTMIFGSDRRTDEWAGTREVIDDILALVKPDDIELASTVMAFADGIKARAQRKGMA